MSNNVTKDRTFQRYLLLDILTNPSIVRLTKKVTFWGKIHHHSLFTYYSLKIIFVPFLKQLARQNSMQKKDDKVGNKTANNEERQRTKEEREA